MSTIIRGSCPKFHEFYMEEGVSTPCPFCLKEELNNQPKISPQLAGMILTTAHNMLQKYKDVDPKKVTDLTNLMTIIKNSIGGS